MERLPEFSNLSSEEKDVLIQTLLVRLDEAFKRIAALEAENTVLRAENKALREQLNRPPKTPDNSSKPPSQGQKASQGSMPRAKRKPHPGNYRALHAQPTRETPVFAGHCGHCQADLTGIPQEPVHAYDRIEIPKIVPDVTRVILHGGVCPLLQRQIQGDAPSGLGAGFAVRPSAQSRQARRRRVPVSLRRVPQRDSGVSAFPQAACFSA